jgi:hypothetical protein
MLFLLPVISESRLPRTVDEAIHRVLNSDKGFAFIGDAMEIKYATLTNCRLQQVSLPFSQKISNSCCKIVLF